MSTLQFLFVCGVPRSGTTAAAQLLNTHRKIAIGIERYKFLYGKADSDISPGLFDRERFFEYRPTDSNIRLDRAFARDYARMASKYDKVRYRGDKVPNLYRCYEQVLAALPSARFLYLVRDPLRTASSWQARATDSGDKWRPQNDFRQAIREWNLANRLTLEFRARHVEHLLVAPYERLFAADDATLRAVIGWLGLPSSEKVVEFHRTHCAPQATGISEKPSLLNAEQESEVGRTAEMALLRDLLADQPG